MHYLVAPISDFAQASPITVIIEAYEYTYTITQR